MNYFYKSIKGKRVLCLNHELEENKKRYFKEISELEYNNSKQIKMYIAEINVLKHELSKTDYVVIKIAEGVSSVEEYASVIEKRQHWRERINELEGLINDSENK